MIINVLLAAADGGGLMDTAKDIGEQFGFQKQLFFSQVISFCVIAFLLHRFAYKPILRVLEERRQKIEQGLANAEKIKQELAHAQVKAQEIIGQAGAQATKLIEEGRQAAARVQEQETQKAIEAANQIIAKAKQASEAELARAKAELRKELVRLVAETTAKVSGKVLTLDDQKRLAEETTKQIAA